MRIKGGYYIKARKIQESEIAIASPCTREVWEYLIRSANHKEKKYAGFIVKRGQCFRSQNGIRDGLKWKVGFRFERYGEEAVRYAMNWLRSRGMIKVVSNAWGTLITVCNYDVYQNPANYDERNDERNDERSNNEPITRMIRIKNKIRESTPAQNVDNSIPPIYENVVKYFYEKRSNQKEAAKFFSYYEANGWKVGKNPMKKWRAAAGLWISRASTDFTATRSEEPVRRTSGGGYLNK